ncbi:hypothetical protein BGL48_15700 [Salinivibrio sp. SS3]|uniref:beta-1,6-N-acetylglucosaminyltransferase n=1 Tax=Salinivibrio sp. SS3 TaxID=1895021 RepID=UPI00084821E3|nr:beta-1,6-N-acetylglucosaminyltransferase [Salinivibrio sp. BNH]ODP96828.1 hypothetical protein BGL48_15700 [Salinivibrio sp. BNH]
MKLLFFIVCHRKTASLFYNLNKLSKFKNSTVLVHIDKKSNFDERDLVKADNIIYVKNRFDVRWGGISQVVTTVDSLNSYIDIDFDYVSLISGEDLVIKTEKQFIDFLRHHNGKEFIGIDKNGDRYFDPKDRYVYKYNSSFYESKPTNLQKIIKITSSVLHKAGFLINKQDLPYESFYKGSNWFTLSKIAVVFILEEIREKDLLRYFKNSLCIDEVIFQTILMNSSFKKNIYLIDDYVTDNEMSLRYVNWIDGPDYPKILDKKDLTRSFENNVFFVRKISPKLTIQELHDLFPMEEL